MPVQQNSHVVAYKQFPIALGIELLKEKIAAGGVTEAEFEGAMFSLETECNKAEISEHSYCLDREYDLEVADLHNQRSAVLSQLL